MWHTSESRLCMSKVLPATIIQSFCADYSITLLSCTVWVTFIYLYCKKALKYFITFELIKKSTSSYLFHFPLSVTVLIFWAFSYCSTGLSFELLFCYFKLLFWFYFLFFIFVLISFSAFTKFQQNHLLLGIHTLLPVMQLFHSQPAFWSDLAEIFVWASEHLWRKIAFASNEWASCLFSITTFVLCTV